MKLVFARSIATSLGQVLQDIHITDPGAVIPQHRRDGDAHNLVAQVEEIRRVRFAKSWRGITKRDAAGYPRSGAAPARRRPGRAARVSPG